MTHKIETNEVLDSDTSVKPFDYYGYGGVYNPSELSQECLEKQGFDCMNSIVENAILMYPSFNYKRHHITDYIMACSSKFMTFSEVRAICDETNNPFEVLKIDDLVVDVKFKIIGYTYSTIDCFHYITRHKKDIEDIDKYEKINKEELLCGELGNYEF
jgi:hypothetical protein